MNAKTAVCPPSARLPGWVLGLLLVGATIAAYWNSLNAPFVFDDIPAIVENGSIRSLWDPAEPPRPGSAVDGRPFVNWSFAVNYALGGTDPRGYHLTNLIIHAGAGLLLWGVLRRTLGGAALPRTLRAHASAIAWASALVWLLHPLQTEAVTCVVQRTESLAGLVFLSALYAFVRAVEPAEPHPHLWLMVSVTAAWLGMATKETMVVLPVVILLFDRTFVAGSFGASWRRRRWYYAGLMLAWMLLALLMAGTEGRGGTATLGREVTAWESLLTQSRAITGYLGLAVWPHPLVMDYGNFVTDGVTSLRAVGPQFVFVSGLGVATLWALVRRPLFGFAGAWFFLNLAPSSSVVPLLTQMRAEHRMYLPLAALLVGAVTMLWRYAGRAAPWVLAGWALGLGAGTVVRNHDYRTAEAIWSDTAGKIPGNPRAHFARARALEEEGDATAAEPAYREALRLRSAYPEANIALALLLLHAGRKDEALPLLGRVPPEGQVSVNVCNNLGYALSLAGDPERAIVAFQQALRLDSADYVALNNLGYLLTLQGRAGEAVDYLRESVTLRPRGGAYENLVSALLQSGHVNQAIGAFEEALLFKPDTPEARFKLGLALVQAEQYADAIDQFTRVVQANPAHRDAWLQLGLLQRQLGRKAASREAFQRVLALDPGNAEATRQLATLAP